jgi:hypothetical protein
LRFGKNGTLVSLSATGKAQKGRKFFVVLLMWIWQRMQELQLVGSILPYICRCDRIHPGLQL